jgi:hypothetical protein
MIRENELPHESHFDSVGDGGFSSQEDLRNVDAHEMDGRILRVVLGLRDWTPAERDRLRTDAKWKKWERHYRTTMNRLEVESPEAITQLRALYRELPAEPERADRRGRNR